MVVFVQRGETRRAAAERGAPPRKLHEGHVADARKHGTRGSMLAVPIKAGARGFRRRARSELVLRKVHNVRKTGRCGHTHQCRRALGWRERAGKGWRCGPAVYLDSGGRRISTSRRVSIPTSTVESGSWVASRGESRIRATLPFHSGRVSRVFQ